MKKFKFIFLLSILFCGLISFSSCEKDEPGKGLSSIGESSAVVSLNGGEFKIGYKVGGTPYRLMTIKVSSNEISFGKNPEYVVSSPEIAALGININSFDEIPEKKYTNSSLSFLSKATLQNTGGYLVRLSSRRPGSSEMIQWVIKLMVSGLNDSSCTIKYIVYCDKLGLSLAYGNEIPNDDNPGGNTGGNGDNPGGNTGGNGDNPGGNTGGNGDNPGGNTGGEDPAKN
ncbi:MAG: hypothetical protein K2N05_02000, partial [Muribaculaceae bacterium]|nr:hypothetical protein [Muribaculaceae bacterium]